MTCISEEQFIKASLTLQSTVQPYYSRKSGQEVTEIYREGRLSLAVVKSGDWTLTTMKVDDQPVVRRQLLKEDVSFEVVGNSDQEQDLLYILGDMQCRS